MNDFTVVNSFKFNKLKSYYDNKGKIGIEDKILHGLEKSHEKLIASKRRNNEELVILQDNRIVKIKP
jgi:hypothetical protein